MQWLLHIFICIISGSPPNAVAPATHTTVVMQSTSPPPKDYLIFSILTCIFCNPLLGEWTAQFYSKFGSDRWFPTCHIILWHGNVDSIVQIPFTVLELSGSKNRKKTIELFQDQLLFFCLGYRARNAMKGICRVRKHLGKLRYGLMLRLSSWPYS